MSRADFYENLDWQNTLKAIASFATSQKGREQILAIQALSTVDAAQDRLEKVTQARGILIQHRARPFFEGLDLYDTWFIPLKKQSTLSALALRDGRLFFLECLALRSILKNSSIFTPLFDPSPLVSHIDQVIHPSGEIRSDASPRLYQLIREKEALTSKITQVMDSLVKSRELAEYLQDKYVTTREGRWVLPIKSGRQHSVSGVIHDSSQTKQTVYIEPQETIPLNNRLREIELEIQEEIERLLSELSQVLFTYVEDIQTAYKEMLQYDVLFSIAQFSEKIQACEFTWSETAIQLENLAHPLMVHDNKNPIRNSIHLGEKRVLLLSGPNAGGKTVLLKSIGLACQMARCGLPVCATAASLPFFKEIIVSIGDHQQVSQELSTFAAHLKVLKEPTQLKGRQSLILIDEIASSTDPEEGGALARAFIERFAENGVVAVITSHLNALKTGWGENSPILMGSMAFDLKSGAPTYHFIAGVSGQSLALEFAKRMGVDNEIIRRAYELLKPETRKRLEALAEAENIKEHLLKLQESLEETRADLEQQKRLWEQKVRAFEEQKQVELNKVLQNAQRKVDELLAEIRASDVLNRHRRAQEIKQQLPDLVKVSSGKIKGSEIQPLTLENFKQRIPPGSKAFVKSLNREGIIQSDPNSRGEVTVFVDSMRINVPWTDIEPALSKTNPTQAILRSSGYYFTPHDEEISLDIRGLTVEKALEELEKTMDRALALRKSRFKVIHGHGTEALKKALRTHLTRSPLVLKWTGGRSDEGGDGITWVELDLE